MAMASEAGGHSASGLGADVGFSEHVGIGGQHTLNVPAFYLG